jgi:Niemann-Pick C1 protein
MVRADKASELNDMVVNKFVLKELLEVETQLRKITVNTTDGMKSTEDLCLHPAGPEEPCMVTSIWWHWNYSLSKMESDPVILSTVARSGFSHPLGFTMPPSTFLGGYEVKYGRVVSARVIKTQFVFTTRLDYQDSLTQLYNAIEETVLAMNKTAVYSSFFVETSTSVTRSLEETLLTEMWPVFVGVILLLVFVVLTLGQFSRVHSKVALGFFGMFTILLSFVVTFGLASAFGIMISTTVLQTLPVLLLGIGVDNIYVLSKAFTQEFANDRDIDASLNRTLNKTGPSIMLSAISVVVVFLSGLFIDIPVIQAICAQTIIAIVANHFLQTITFSSAMVLDARRIKANRLDCCCTVRAKKRTKTDDSSDENKSDSRASTKKERKTKCGKNAIPRALIAMSTHRTSQIIFIVVFVGYFAFNIFATTQITEGLEISSLMAKNTPIRRYTDISDQYFGNTLPFFIVYPQLDYADANTTAMLNQHYKLLQASGSISSLTSWHFNFLSWLIFLSPHSDEYRANHDQIPPHKFYPWLQEFLNGTGKAHRGDLVFNENGLIKWSRMLGTLTETASLPELLTHSKVVHGIISEVSGTIFFSPFSFSLGHFDKLKTYAIVVLSVSIGCVFITTSTLLYNVMLGAVCTIILAIVGVEVLGLHFIFGAKFNALSVINVAATFALGVEYISHILRIFNISDAPQRLEKTLNYVGNMISMSVVSSLISVFLLLFSEFQLIQMYFGVTWFFALLFAGLHALIFIPTILSINEEIRTK